MGKLVEGQVSENLGCKVFVLEAWHQVLFSRLPFSNWDETYLLGVRMFSEHTEVHVIMIRVI